MNTLTVIKDRRDLKVLSFSPGFLVDGERYIVHTDEEKLVVTRPTIDHQGRTYLARKKETGSHMILNVTRDIPIGKFDIDEDDSNEDQLVIYF